MTIYDHSIIVTFTIDIAFVMLQAVDGLYCVGDSCFPGQGVIAVAFSGTMCAHRVAADLGK